MIKTTERMRRLMNFIRDCVERKYTGQLIIHFKQGCPSDITRNEKIVLDKDK